MRRICRVDVDSDKGRWDDERRIMHARVKAKMGITVDINADRRPVKQQRTKPRDQTKAGNANSLKKSVIRWRKRECARECYEIDIISSSGAGNPGPGSLRSLTSLTSLTTLEGTSGGAEKWAWVA